MLVVFVRKEKNMRKERGFTLLELLIVVVILGVLALIAAPTLLNAADKAKEGAVRANVSAGSSSVTTQLTVEDRDAADSATNSVSDLNSQGTTGTDDDAKSPFNTSENAFVDGSAAEAGGQVTLDGAAGEYTVTVTGWNKAGDAALTGATKTVSAPQSASST